MSAGEIVKDASLLRELKPLWREHGCAFCGRSVSPVAVQDGFDVELAHVMGRGMGGGRRRDVPDNILGLCGGLTENQCHLRFDKYEIGIFTNTAGDEAWEVKTGAPLVVGGRPVRNGLVRRLRSDALERGVSTPGPRSVGALLRGAQAAAHSGGPAVAADAPALPAAAPDGYVRDERGAVIPEKYATAALLERHPGAVLTGEVLPATNGTPDSPEGRLVLIRELVRVAERNRIAASLLLLKAWEDREYESLQMDWPEYYQGCGIAKSEASKMLTVARTFRGQLVELPREDADELSLERAYLAARLVKDEVMGHTDALAAAVSTPSSGLVALLKGDEPADRHVCPECGNNHVRRVDE